MAEAKKDAAENPPPKKESFVVFLIALVIVSVVAIGAGWFVNGQLRSSQMVAETKAPQKDKKDKKSSDHGEDEGKDGDKQSGGIILLEPIIVGMKKSDNAFLRLELVLVAKDGASLDDEETKLRIGSEIAAFAQTLTLQQISSPSGYLHFREDILDRARLSTDGQVDEVYIMSMVAE